MTTPLPVSTGRESLRYVWGISRPYRGRLLLVLILGIVSAAAGLVAPIAIGFLVDAAQDGTASAWTVVWMVAVMIVAAVSGALGAAITIVVAARVYHSILASLRERLVSRAFALPQNVVERAGTGDLISRTSDDVARIADAAPSIIPAFTMTAFTLSVTVAGMAAVDWWYGVALVVLLPLYVATVRWYLRTAPAIYQAERAAMSTRAQQLVESQRGHDTIAGLNLSEIRHTRVLTASWGVVGFALKTRTVQNMFFGRLNLAEYVGLSAILIVGFAALSGGQTTVGAITAAVLLFMRLFGPINQFLLVFDTLQSVAASLNRMVGVVTAPIPEAPYPTTSPRRAEHAVFADRVSFAYDDAAPVLHDVTLAVPFGHRIAIVGASGAGKTTLASVVAGTHPPTHGSISRPEHTVVVTQETHVFSGSITDNLLLARPDATEAEALVIAHRLSQAAACHHIVVMDRGRVIEHGDHDSLRESGGVYAQLWAAWSAPRGLPPDA